MAKAKKTKKATTKGRKQFDKGVDGGIEVLAATVVSHLQRLQRESRLAAIAELRDAIESIELDRDEDEIKDEIGSALYHLGEARSAGNIIYDIENGELRS